MSEATVRIAHRDGVWQRFSDALPPRSVLALAAGAGLLIPLLLLRYPMEYAIGGVVGLIVTTGVVAYPYVGLLVFLGLLYVRPEEIVPQLAGARFTLAVSLLVFFSWAVNALLCRERFKFHLPAVRCFLGFLAVAIASTGLSGSASFGDQALELVKLLILFLLIIHLVNTPGRLWAATGALVLFTAILGARTLWLFQNGQDFVVSDGAERAMATGIFGDPNDLALAMAMALPLALGACFGKRTWWTRLWNLGTIPIFLWTIYVTNSRGGMMALAAGLFAFFSRRMGRLGLVLGTVAVLALFAYGPSRMSEMSSDEDSAQGRVVAWQAGIDMLRLRPVWGVGKGQFLEYHFRTAHNSLVLCLAELGMLGTGLWIGLFYFALRGGRQATGSEPNVEHDTEPRRTRSGHPARAPSEASPTSPAHAQASAPGRERSDGTARRYAMPLQVSLITFMVGGFFLSRTYTPPLYVYLGLAIAAVQVEAQEAGRVVLPASLRDWRNIAALTVGALLLVILLVHLWS